MDVKKLAGDAIAVQDACNSSGVVYALGRVVSDLMTGNDVEKLKDHPVIIMWADKLDDLCRCRDKAALPTDELITHLMLEFVVEMDKVCELRLDTDSKNTHPSVQERVLKLVYACDSRGADRLGQAIDACNRMKETGVNETL